MRIVLQRVQSASVHIGGTLAGAIKTGYVLLLGIEDADAADDINWLVNKVKRLRLFNDNQGQMNISLGDMEGELLIVSQFTLHASVKKGNRPSFIRAAKPETARPLYQNFIRACEQQFPGKIQTGVFGAAMKVSLVNDGPVTLILDSKNKNL